VHGTNAIIDFLSALLLATRFGFRDKPALFKIKKLNYSEIVPPRGL